MAILNLRPFGFNLEVQLRGRIKRQWMGGSRVVFLVGEYHANHGMITDNLLDACSLIKTGVVECAGVEDTIHAPAQLTLAQIERDSLQLFHKHCTDEAVIAHIRTMPFSFRFGRTLSYLRPRLPLACVEDPDLHGEACRIENRLQDQGESTEHWPDLRVHRERERRFVENLFQLWEVVGNGASGAAMLNTGSAHSEHIADRLRTMETSFVLVDQPGARHHP
jgi:hypothetical protein